MQAKVEAAFSIVTSVVFTVKSGTANAAQVDPFKIPGQR